MLYLDHNGTTPISPKVREVISRTLEDSWGNPSSRSYVSAITSKNAIEKARSQIATLISAESPEQIYFTSGGTESNNWVLRSVSEKYDRPHVVITTVEHDSVLLAARALRDQDRLRLTEVPLDDGGVLSPVDVVGACTPDTRLVSVMLANNETGVLFDVAGVAAAVREQFPDCLIHTDAAQAIGKVPVSVKDLGVDYLTIVGHKFYGPRIGALYASTPLRPLFYGGGQEKGLRPGTENTPMIAGLGEAAEQAAGAVSAVCTAEVRDRFEGLLLKELGEKVVEIHCRIAPRLPNTSNFALRGTRSRKVLERVGFVASRGAACHSDRETPSQVLLNSGVSPEDALCSIRISFGRHSTLADAEFAVSELVRAVNQ